MLKLQSSRNVTSPRLVYGVTFGNEIECENTSTMIVFTSRTMHPQSPPLTIGGTVLKESDGIYISGMIFNLKMTFEKHHSSDSTATFQRLGILWKSCRVFIDRLQ